MSKSQDNLKKNRIACNVEDVVYEAFFALAEQENTSSSELLRSVIITELIRAGLLPDSTLRRLAGSRL